ncbi:hypothetical protein [Stenotrophomonas sp. GD03657]|uniref:hypothetical protein n=1 Tax=Stenotrophomonas sp. GD03657 TaxID=2975363 RepID=UPI00244A9B5C|nr:hypothetical protein [Stenotrophomonas sp. GD03657]MDH2154297.1 hypothetical protein [Stenotrophomonas sp. GD03657]
MNNWGHLIAVKVRLLVKRIKRYYQKVEITYDAPFEVTGFINKRRYPNIKAMMITVTPGREQFLHRGKPVGEPKDWWVADVKTIMHDGTVYSASIINSWNPRTAIQHAQLKGLEIQVAHGYKLAGHETAQTGRG